MWPGRPSRSCRSQPGPLELSGSRDKAGGSTDVREPTQNKSPGRGHGGGVEKYSRFLQPPLHPAGHDWETKPLQQRLPLKGCSPPHIWLCVGRCRSGGTALFSCMRQGFACLSELLLRRRSAADGHVRAARGPRPSPPATPLKGPTRISWFTLNFGMKPRLTPGKQCSL